MRIKTAITNLGVSISVQYGDGQLKGAQDRVSDQQNPVGFYVYAHCDRKGTVFYVGKGRGRRAWSKDRHPLWTRYVEKHLSGEYEVKIMADGLTLGQAEEREAEIIAEHGDCLVNWDSAGRSTNFELLDRYHALRDANRALLDRAKQLESSELSCAVECYQCAIGKIAEYAFLDLEQGLVGQLLREERDEQGPRGELQALDRLTLCLTKLGRAEEAAAATDAYFALYKRDLSLKGSERIKKRVEKALARIRQLSELEPRRESATV